MIVKRRTRGTNGIRPARLAEVSFQLHYAQTQRQSRCQIYTTTTWDYTTLKLEAYEIPYELVRPQKWKKEFSVTADKNTSIEVCKRLFPGVNLIPPGCRKEHDGMAESLLMALYAKRRLG